MAITWLKKTLTVQMANEAMRDTLPLYGPEGASQTFLAASPIVLSSGLWVVGSDPITTVEGFAMEDGHNTTGATIKFVPAAVWAGIHLFGNFLSTAAADNVLATADLGGKVNINYEAAGGSGGEAIWHLGDSASNPGARIVEFRCDPGSLPPNSDVTAPANGDTNARVRAALLDSAADWAV